MSHRDTHRKSQCQGFQEERDEYRKDHLAARVGAAEQVWGGIEHIEVPGASMAGDSAHWVSRGAIWWLPTQGDGNIPGGTLLAFLEFWQCRKCCKETILHRAWSGF